VSFRSEPLDAARHNLAALDSGEPTLDKWLREQAAGAEDRRVGRTFVWVLADGDLDMVVGYYTLLGHRLVRDDIPRSIGRGSPAEVPAVLLAKLALDKSLQGSGNGGILLVDALGRILVATEQVAARFVVVDAIHDEAAALYSKHGFKRIPDSLRLARKISDIAKDLDVD
jgi:GNAT superfamily N-acetyltransferase